MNWLHHVPTIVSGLRDVLIIVALVVLIVRELRA